jgi:hypothetical protein
LNALSPIVVTPLGIVTDVREMHDMKPLAPIDVTLLGIVKLENTDKSQFRNAKQASLELIVEDKQP